MSTRLANRLRSLQLRAYPAHGMGFVTIVSDYEPGFQIVQDVQAAAERIDELEAALHHYTGGSHCNPARIALGLRPFENGIKPLTEGSDK